MNDIPPTAKQVRSLENEGFFLTPQKLANALHWEIRKRCRTIFGPRPERRFTTYYLTNKWQNDESVSGDGSTAKYTENLRKELPELVRNFKIKSMFDAPCGDFNWMRLVIDELQVSYIGGDIVKQLVAENNREYGKKGVHFVRFDITKDRFPTVDLWICRECIFHLSFKDAFRAIRQFIVSEIPYIATTTQTPPDGHENRDCISGDYRLIDLFSAPYYFDKEPLYKIDDYIDPYPPAQLCLWSREQVIRSLNKNSKG